MLRTLLRLPRVYRSFSRLFNVDEVHRRFVQESGYRPGLRTLDIGCGPGELAQYIAPADFTGIDISEDYIRFARTHHGGSFHTLSADCVGELEGPFDLALMFGVFHHLSDVQVRATLAGLASVLHPAGKFVLLEAVWPSRRWDLPGYVLRRLDRGAHVRSRAAWCRLLGETWTVTDVRIPRNFLIEYFGCTLIPPSAAGHITEIIDAA
jgi:SAM-dependent methyltransferase